MDTGLRPVSQENYGSYLNPFGGASDQDVTQDGLCQNGAEIFLKRIFNKLFKQVNELQPDELDEEFIYQSTISYRDYLEMSKIINEEQINCASLINMENILSKIMSGAIVRRPMHTSMFGNLLFQSTPLSLSNGSGMLSSISATLQIHLLMVLIIVGFTAWFLNSKIGIKLWNALPLSIMLVGFIEFCMHKNDLKMKYRLSSERCRNPSIIARFASLVNYDYDNCNLDTANDAASIPNIAFTGVEYLSELIFQPVVNIAGKLGSALQSYFDAFKGFNYILAPIFPILALIAFSVLTVPLLFFVLYRFRQPAAPYVPNQRQAKSPKKLKTNSNNQRNNAIK